MKTKKYPIIEKGSHLTVITHENGKTELQWDDKALARDVKNAIDEYLKNNLEKPVKKSKKTKQDK